jgi:site-specific DNA-cytosine methylase
LAGFPYESFSNSGIKEVLLHTRVTLFLEWKLNVLEHVESLLKHGGGRTLTNILRKLKKLGYQVKCVIFNA